MAEQDRNGFPDQRASSSFKSPLTTYLSYVILPSLFLLLFIFSVYLLLLPFSIGTIAGWLVALVAGSVLAAMLTMGLMYVWMKKRIVGIVVTVLVALLWLGWVFLLPKPAIPGVDQVPFQLIALLLPWLIALPVSLLGLFGASRYLLPIEKISLRDMFRVLQTLIDYIWRQNYPFYVVVDEPLEVDRVVQRGHGDRFSDFAQGSGLVITDCNYAIAISDGVQFKGIQGPGVIFCGFADQAIRTIDLRPQQRLFEVKAQTKDGIRIKVLTITTVWIDRGEQVPELGAPMPYRKSAAFKAVHAQEVAPSPDGEVKQHNWEQLPVTIGSRVLQDIISRYNFDDLYAPFEIEGELPRESIASEFRERLKKELEPMGIYLQVGAISNLIPENKEILQHRISSWQARWAREAMIEQARSQTDRLQRIEHARAKAQADLILHLGEMLSQLSRPGVGVTPEVVMPEFLRILEEMALRPAVQGYLPPNTVESARRLRAPFDNSRRQGA
ncbi:MAG: hypothetical protein JW900_09100 [Anaerolineae bacterium]|nr:hypothetical protein [Anaerolineae bacterium]